MHIHLSRPIRAFLGIIVLGSAIAVALSPRVRYVAIVVVTAAVAVAALPALRRRVRLTPTMPRRCILKGYELGRATCPTCLAWQRRRDTVAHAVCDRAAFEAASWRELVASHRQ